MMISVWVAEAKGAATISMESREKIIAMRFITTILLECRLVKDAEFRLSRSVALL
jgi:hypothetical protein